MAAALLLALKATAYHGEDNNWLVRVDGRILLWSTGSSLKRLVTENLQLCTLTGGRLTLFVGPAQLATRV